MTGLINFVYGEYFVLCTHTRNKYWFPMVSIIKEFQCTTQLTVHQALYCLATLHAAFHMQPSLTEILHGSSPEIISSQSCKQMLPCSCQTASLWLLSLKLIVCLKCALVTHSHEYMPTVVASIWKMRATCSESESLTRCNQITGTVVASSWVTTKPGLWTGTWNGLWTGLDYGLAHQLLKIIIELS